MFESGYSFFFKKNSSRLYFLIVRVLLLEHSHKVVSTSSIYFIKLVSRCSLVNSDSFILEGRKVAYAKRCRHNVIVRFLLFANYYESKFV